LTRKAFGLMGAIFIILIVSFMLIITLKYARIGAKHTVDTYTKEQAELFMQSAIEMALLQISDFNRSNGKCLKIVHVSDQRGRFTVDINITKYYLNSSLSDCDRVQVINTPQSEGMVLMDVMLESNISNGANGKQVRIFRRTMQKP